VYTKQVIRHFSVISLSDQLRTLHTIDKFPAFMGCVEDFDVENDIYAELSFDICTKTGVIQIRNILPLDIVYLEQHNDGTGSTWEKHYFEFAKFLVSQRPDEILEIGGSHTKIAKHARTLGPIRSWKILEPHPLFQDSEIAKLEVGWFDENYLVSKNIDTIVHSHVLEHTYDPRYFLNSISNQLKNGDKHVFSLPNMKAMLRSKFTNCLNFEHTIFLEEEIIDTLLQEAGFKVVHKEYFEQHSIFYSSVKVSEPTKLSSYFGQKNEDKLRENTALLNDFIGYHRDLIKRLNDEISNYSGPVFLFGAHIFSQFLLASGLDSTKIVSILDNSPMKKGKRLYGTPFSVYGLDHLSYIRDCSVILAAGSYQKEISAQLKSINPRVKIFE
jgi:hypothetical protein